MRAWHDWIEQGVDMNMFTPEELREEHEIRRDLRIRDNAQELYKAMLQIKELIDQEHEHPRPYEVYQGIRDLANQIVNRMEGRGEVQT